MIKERISLSGDLKSKVKQLMIYAGWYEGRKVDISIASQYYAERGVPMMKSTQRFYHKYFGLCCQWYFSGGMKRAADFELFASYGIQTNSNPYGGRQRTPKSPQLLIILKLMC